MPMVSLCSCDGEVEQFDPGWPRPEYKCLSKDSRFLETTNPKSFAPEVGYGQEQISACLQAHHVRCVGQKLRKTSMSAMPADLSRHEFD